MLVAEVEEGHVQAQCLLERRIQLLKLKNLPLQKSPAWVKSGSGGPNKPILNPENSKNAGANGSIKPYFVTTISIGENSNSSLLDLLGPNGYISFVLVLRGKTKLVRSVVLQRLNRKLVSEVTILSKKGREKKWNTKFTSQ